MKISRLSEEGQWHGKTKRSETWQKAQSKIEGISGLWIFEKEYTASATDIISYLEERGIEAERRKVHLRCINVLLDTMIERFGTKTASYTKADDNHFIVAAGVEVSEQFFGWLLGFGKKVVLLDPAPTVQQFREYIDKVRKMY